MTGSKSFEQLYFQTAWILFVEYVAQRIYIKHDVTHLIDSQPLIQNLKWNIPLNTGVMTAVGSSSPNALLQLPVLLQNIEGTPLFEKLKTFLEPDRCATLLFRSESWLSSACSSSSRR